MSPWFPYSRDQQSGHQGDGSAESEPARRRRIDEAFRYLEQAGARGLTWAEFASAVGIHHGSASSALSNLHRTGAAMRLAEKRNKSGIYVLPKHVHDRETREYRSHRSVDIASLISRIEELREEYDSQTIDAVIEIIEGV